MIKKYLRKFANPLRNEDIQVPKGTHHSLHIAHVTRMSDSFLTSEPRAEDFCVSATICFPSPASHLPHLPLHYLPLLPPLPPSFSILSLLSISLISLSISSPSSPSSPTSPSPTSSSPPSPSSSSSPSLSSPNLRRERCHDRPFPRRSSLE